MSSASVTSKANATERRQHRRCILPPMYSSITITHGREMTLETSHGHAYDASEGGIRFELDTTLDIGAFVSFQLDLPGAGGVVSGTGTIVRVYDEIDDPGPRRMALAVLRFNTACDRTRLLNLLASGELKTAA